MKTKTNQMKSKTISKFIVCMLLTACWALLPTTYCSAQTQGAAINTTGASADPSAILDVSSTTQGALIPRMTTLERDAIVAPAQALMIYNLTTKCLEIYEYGIWQPLTCATCAPTAVTASASPNPVCSGSALTLTGNATGATSWSWTGPNGFTSALQNPVITSAAAAASGIYTLVASNSCGAAKAVNTIWVTVSAPPTTANAGTNQTLGCGVSTTTLAGNNPSVGTGTWSVVSGNPGLNITTPSAYNSGVTGLDVSGTNTVTLRWTISSPGCTSSSSTMTITTCYLPVCTWNGATTFSVTHTAGTVAPVNKTVTYNQTQTSLSGASKCWIIQNLGADNVATSATDGTETAAGWYWQFNRPQGYKHDGTTRTPGTTWPVNSQSGNWTSGNDPCTLLLGADWRMPTWAEWSAVNTAGGWTSLTNAYASVLKIHAAGLLNYSTAALSGRGSGGFGEFWSSTFASPNALYVTTSSSAGVGANVSSGCSIRCLRP
jgi:hypothetical protein